MKIFCQFVTPSTKEVAKRLGKNANYINNIESYFVTNHIVDSNQLTASKIEERVRRIQDFLNTKKEEAKLVRYAIPEYTTGRNTWAKESAKGNNLVSVDIDTGKLTLTPFKNATEFLNWMDYMHYPEFIKTPQDAYLYALWANAERTYTDAADKEVLEIAKSKLINYRKEIAPYTKEDLQRYEILKEGEKNNAIQEGGNTTTIEYTPVGKTRQTYTIKGSHIFNKEGKEVFKEDSRDRNKIFANLAVQQGRAVVVEHKGASYVVNNRDQIISVATGKIMQWGNENGDKKAILQEAASAFAQKQMSDPNNAAALKQASTAKTANDSLDRSAGKKFEESNNNSIKGKDEKEEGTDESKNSKNDKAETSSLDELNPEGLQNQFEVEFNLGEDNQPQSTSEERRVKAEEYFSKMHEKNRQEEAAQRKAINEALAYIEKSIKELPFSGSITANDESPLTRLGKLITPTQLNDRLNYIARSFSGQIDTAVEEMIAKTNEDLQQAEQAKDIKLVRKLKSTLNVLQDEDRQRAKAVKMVGSNTIIDRMKQEIQDAINNSEDPNIKNQYQILSDYFVDIFNLATPIMEQYENVRFTLHKTTFADGSNIKEGSDIEVQQSEDTQENEDNAYEDSDDGDRMATGNEGWSFKIKFLDPHKTLSKEVKRVLYNIVKTNGDEIDVDDLGQTRYLPFNQAYAILLDKLANKIVEPKDFIHKDEDGNISYPLLEQMTNKFPWVSQVLDALDVDNSDGNGNLGTLFYSNFKRYFTHYYMLRGNKFFAMNEMTPVESALAETTGNYEHGNILDSNSIYNSDKSINQEHVSNVREMLKKVDTLVPHYSENYVEISTYLNAILRSCGFNTTVQELTGLAEDPDFMGNYRAIKTAVNRILTNAENLGDKHLINECKEEIKQIAPVLGTVSELNNCTSFRQAGNTYPSYTPCSFVSNMMDHLKSDDYYKDYIEESFKPYEGWFYDSEKGRYLNGWLDLIMNNEDVRKHLSIREMNYIGEESDDLIGSGPGTTYKYNKWTSPQIRKTFLHLYFDTPNNSSSKIQYADYAFPIFSDSEMSMFIRMPKYVKNFRERLLPKFVDLAHQEINRIVKVQKRADKGVSKIQNFDDNGKDFLFIPELNAYRSDIFKYIDEKDMIGLDQFLKGKLREIFDQKVQDNLGKNEDVIVAYIQESANVKTKEEALEKFAEFFWNNAYAQSQIMQLTTTDLAYYRDMTDFQKRFKEVYASGTRLNSESKYGKKAFNTIYLADKIVTSNSYKLVEETLDKAVKDGRLSKSEKYSILEKFGAINATDAQGFRTLTSYRSMLDMLGQWTPKLEDLYYRLNNDLWDYSDFENVLQTLKPFAYTQTIQNDGLGGKIRVGHQIKDSEFVLLSLYNTLAMGGRTDTSQNRGSATLRALNDFMEKNGIDTAIFESGIKAGGQGIIDITHSELGVEKALETKLPNKDGKDIILEDAILHEYTLAHGQKQGKKEFDRATPAERFDWGLNQMLKNDRIPQEAFNKFQKMVEPTEAEVIRTLTDNCTTLKNEGDVLEDLSGNGVMLNTSVVHAIPTADYMIAQQNPEHLADAQSVAGSQNRNLVDADLPGDIEITLTNNFTGEKHTLNKQQINKMCSDLVIENLLEDFETLRKDFKNIETIQKMLIKSVQASNKYGVDMINALQLVEVNGKKQFNIPTNNINTLNKLQELVLSVFKNRITKQKNMKGGACTLVSSFGFTNDLHVIKDANGNLQFEVYMPWHSQKHLSPFLTDVLDDDGRVIGKKVDIEKIKQNDPKLLEGFGYRIPTEGKYSMMSFVIKGFLPQENGSTIMLPADTTVYAGEDFDKLCVEVKLC